MPHLNGYDLAERIRYENPELKVLFISGYTDDTVVRSGVSQENMDFLQKPFSSTTLLNKIREILD